MAKVVWQGFVLSPTNGKPVSGAEIRVFDADSGLATTLYSDRAGSAWTDGNPFFTGPDGFVQFYVDPKRIRVEAYEGSQVARFDDVLVGTVDDGGIVTANLADGAVNRAKVNEDIVTQVSDMTGLLALTPDGEGQVVATAQYLPSYSTGGTTYIWSPSTLKSGHNGGTVISPTVPWDGSQANLADFLAGTGETDPSGSGCWLIKSDIITNMMFGAVSDNVDSFAANQAFLDDFSANPRSSMYEFIGDTYISATLECVGTTDSTMNFDARIYNYAAYVDGPALRWGTSLSSMNYTRISGFLRILGTGAGGVDRGFKYGLESNNTARLQIDYLSVTNVMYWGWKPNAQSNIMSANKTVFRLCGFRDAAAHPDATATAEITAKTGGSGSSSQRTTLSITGAIHEQEDCQFVRIDDNIYFVTSSDTGTGTLEIFPNMPDSVGYSTTIQYYAGGGIRMRSNDVGVCNIDSIEATFCGVAVYSGSLYGSRFSNVTSQFCGIAIAFGQGVTNASLGHRFELPYFEATEYHIVQIGLNSDAVITATSGGLDYSKCGRIDAIIGSLPGLKSFSKTHLLNQNGILSGRTVPFSSSSLEVADSTHFSAPTFMGYRYHNSASDLDVRLQQDDDNAALWGAAHGFLTIYDARGSVRFYPLDVAHTVMGGADYTVQNLPDTVLVSYKLVGTDWKVSIFSGGAPDLRGTASYDPPSIPDGAAETTTVSVVGAALGDFAAASFSNDLQGITLHAWVSAADTVSVRLSNHTGGAVDLAAGTLLAKVEKT